MLITIRDMRTTPIRYYRADVSASFARKHDNGALISCGLTVPDSLPAASLDRLITTKRAHEIDAETFNHSGCQSSCILRGASKCTW